MLTTPYHAGERQVQQRLGEELVAARHASAIRTTIPASVVAQLVLLPLVIVSSLDAEGQVWTSVLQGSPGFAHSPLPTQVALNLTRVAASSDDVLWANLALQPEVSLLFIDFPTKWRFRVNGRVRTMVTEWVVDIDQAFLNCPQYLQDHPVALTGSGGIAPAAVVPAPGGARTAGPGAPPTLADWVRLADSFFVGSSDGNQALDTAYRGGMAGFVQFEDGGTLLVPDYVGNSMYNSLGNFALDDSAGLLFLDPTTGRALQLTGRVEVLWSGAGPVEATGGTGRYWRFTPTEWVESALPAALPFI